MLALAAPPLPRTTDLYALDRAVVRLGTFLADRGHRRAAARAPGRARRRERAAAELELGARRRAFVEQRRDNRAQLNPLGLR
jgi:hypothetical protein